MEARLNTFSRQELEAFRELFGHTDGKVYLNHAAVSPLPLPTKLSMVRYLEERSSGKIDDFHGNMRIMDETRVLLARLVGADPEEIALTGNTSEGLNILANGMDWKEGDRILLNDMEFPSNVYPFMNLERKGVVVDFARTDSVRIDPTDLEGAITERTRLLSISHVSFLSGFRADVAAIAEMCRRRGVALSVDAIQSVGVVPVDVSTWGIDALACGGHKWLMSPQGTGFLFLGKDFRENVRPAYVSWLSVKEPFRFLEYGLELRDDAGVFEMATPNVVGIAGMRSSVSLLLEIGIERIERHVLSLLSFLSERLGEMGIDVVGDFREEERSGILLFRMENAGALVESLREEGIVVAEREGAVRVSPHFYNSPDDIERLVSSIARFLRKGAGGGRVQK